MKKKKPTIIILHGWELYGEKYSTLSDMLEKKGFRVLAPDFPGFGHTPLHNKNMNLSDYSHFLEGYLKHNKVSECVLVGHSFGGRVGIRYTSDHPSKVLLLILTGVPIIRHFGFKKRIMYILAKSMKFPFMIMPTLISSLARRILYRVTGEYDYARSGEKKNIFKNIINESLIPILQKLKTPTVLIWGELDRLTPASDIVKITQIGTIVDSESVPGLGHSLPYQNPKVFSELVEKYISRYA